MEKVNSDNQDLELYQIEGSSTTVFDKITAYISQKYKIRYNETALVFEIRSEKVEWTELNLNSLFIELSQVGIETTLNKLEILMRSHLIPKYNPLEEYFKNLPKWDGQDHIGKLCTYVKTCDNPHFRKHFEKWLTRAVLCALKDGYVNKQCLVLYNTLQNSGKTTFLRFICPPELQMYYIENISVDKDGLIALCKNLVVNVDELSIMARQDVDALKSFISKNTVNVRLPYDRKSTLLRRTATFCGSTNRFDFLTDETGSVRWQIFEVLSIDFSYQDKVDITQVWAHAFHNAFERKNYNPELTQEDVKENELRNDRFKQVSLEQEILINHYEKSQTINEFLTPSEIMLAMNIALGIRLNIVKIGKALTAMQYERIKHPKRQVYGYLIRRKGDELAK